MSGRAIPERASGIVADAEERVRAVTAPLNPRQGFAGRPARNVPGGTGRCSPAADSVATGLEGLPVGRKAVGAIPTDYEGHTKGQALSMGRVNLITGMVQEGTC